MWQGIEGHDEVVDRFRKTLRHGRLASTYLFVGPAGIGKRTFALRLAQSLLCGQVPDEQLTYCGECESCRLAAAGTHPDLLVAQLPEGKSTLPIELFIGDRDHRHQTGLCHHFSLKPFLGNRRIAVIDDVDHFSQESANCLLKTLEEPPPDSLLILIGTSPSRQLLTIRSRAQLVHFSPLSQETFLRLAIANGIVEDLAAAQRLAGISNGSLERARQLAAPELWEFRGILSRYLDQPEIDAVGTAELVSDFVDKAGKEASARRARLKTVLQFAADFYREKMRNDHRVETIGQLDHCLKAAEYIDRNANQATLIQWWTSQLGLHKSAPAHPAGEVARSC